MTHNDNDLDAAVERLERAYSEPLTPICAEVCRADIRLVLDALAEAKNALAKYPSPLVCPCCGDEAACPKFYEDGQETTCGCGGTVMADDGYAHISVDQCESPKCAETEPRP